MIYRVWYLDPDGVKHFISVEPDKYGGESFSKAGFWVDENWRKPSPTSKGVYWIPPHRIVATQIIENGRVGDD